MAAPSYTTDLTTITDCDSGTFFEFTGYSAGTLQAVPETDYYIQDSSGSGGCVSSTAKTTLCSIGFNNGSGVTVPTDGAVLFWQTYWAVASMNTFANGGQRCIIGSNVGDFNVWKSGGNDYSPNPYGGWKNVAVDPTVTQDYQAGSPTSTLQYFGIAINLPSTYPSKGAMFGMDAIRYGRCEFRVANGDGTSGYATFAGMAATNDALAARWGLFQAIAGGYSWKGLMTLGYSTAVDFRDSNKSIVIDDCPRVGANFNKIEIRQASSRVDWTNISIQSLADSTYGTVSKGRFEVIDDCDVNFDGCTFTDMDTFIFLGTSTVLDCTFRRCGQITAGAANFAGTLFTGYEGTADTGYLDWGNSADPSTKLANCTFVKGTASTHAIQFGTACPDSINIPNSCTFSGYNASNDQTDSTVYIARTTGAVTIYYDGTLSYKSAGATVTVSASNTTVTLTGMKDNTEVRVYSAGTTTELDGIENATGGTPGNRSFAFSLASATSIDIRIYAVGYLPADILAYSVPASDTSIPIQQIYDRNYSNL